MAELDIFNSPRIKAVREKVANAKGESEKKSFLISLAKEIVNKLNDVTISGMEDGISVDNFDEVTASLRNELSRANKPLMKMLKSLNLTTQEQTQVIEAIEQRAEKEFRSQFQPILIKRPKDRVEVSNLEEILVPESVSVNNLEELQPLFDALSNVIKETFNVEIPAPQVTIPAPIVNVPETKIEIPEIQLDELVKEIRSGLNKIRTNGVSRPLAVRLSDGQQWLNEIVAKMESMNTTLAGFSDQIRLRGKTGGTINPATEESVSTPGSIISGNKDVASAGTAVKLLATDTPCKEVIITGKAANTNKIYIGGSTVASTDGTFIYASQTLRISINDVSKIYIDSDTNGEGVQFSYVV